MEKQIAETKSQHRHPTERAALSCSFCNAANYAFEGKSTRPQWTPGKIGDLKLSIQLQLYQESRKKTTRFKIHRCSIHQRISIFHSPFCLRAEARWEPESVKMVDAKIPLDVPTNSWLSETRFVNASSFLYFLQLLTAILA